MHHRDDQNGFWLNRIENAVRKSVGQTSPDILLDHSPTFGRFKDAMDSSFYFEREGST